MEKKNIIFIIILISTVILGAIAVLTALKLREIGNEPVAPTAPTSKPKAVEVSPSPAAEEVDPNCVLEFTVSGVATPTPTPTPSATPTPSPELGCYTTCSDDADCEGDLTCETFGSEKKCANSSCKDESDCTCNVSCWQKCDSDTQCSSDRTCRQIDDTKRCVNIKCDREQDCDCTITISSPSPSSKAVVKASPKPSPELPEAGVITPTLFVGAAGILLVVLGLLL